MEILGEPTPVAEYFAAVEEQFGRLRGRPLLLSPRDVGIVKQWFEAGVPLRAALKGLERFFERERHRDRPRRRPPTLEYCERDVFEMWEEWRETRLGGEEDEAPGRGSASGAMRAHLGSLAGRLEQARDAARAAGAARVARALDRTLAALAEPGSASAPVEELEERLCEEEKRVLAAIRRELGEEGVQALRHEVAARVRGLSGGIDERGFEVLARKAEDRALLARYGIPRIALFTF